MTAITLQSRMRINNKRYNILRRRRRLPNLIRHDNNKNNWCNKIIRTSLSSSRILSMRYRSQNFVISKSTSSTEDLTVACFCQEESKTASVFPRLQFQAWVLIKGETHHLKFLWTAFLQDYSKQPTCYLHGKKKYQEWNKDLSILYYFLFISYKDQHFSEVDTFSFNARLI